jgi:hypothetical protein
MNVQLSLLLLALVVAVSQGYRLIVQAGSTTNNGTTTCTGAVSYDAIRNNNV